MLICVFANPLYSAANYLLINISGIVEYSRFFWNINRTFLGKSKSFHNGFWIDYKISKKNTVVLKHSKSFLNSIRNWWNILEASTKIGRTLLEAFIECVRKRNFENFGIFSMKMINMEIS